MAELARRRRRQRVVDQPMGRADRALLRGRRRLPQSGGPVDRSWPFRKPRLPASACISSTCSKVNRSWPPFGHTATKWVKRPTATDFRPWSISGWPKRGVSGSRCFSSSDWKTSAICPTGIRPTRWRSTTCARRRSTRSWCSLRAPRSPTILRATTKNNRRTGSIGPIRTAAIRSPTSRNRRPIGSN